MITQLNATYVPDEDRVLFRFNTADGNEFRLWLTRAMVRLTLGGLTELMTKAQVTEAQDVQQAKAIADFKQETIQQQTTFTDFQPAQKLPLGDAPILVIRLRLDLESKTYVVAFDLVNQKTITLKLDELLFGKMRLLLSTIQEKAAWNLSALAGDKRTEEKELVPQSGGPAGPLLH